MTTINATVRNGRIEPDQPIDLPDGTVLQLMLRGDEAKMEADEMSAAEIAQVLQAMDRMEPLEMTEAELVSWEADRQARRQWEKAHFLKRADKLRQGWE
ncbi:MAG: hypothetical protein ACRD36_02965 [Candidatus Acidiferrum sp.]